MAEWSRVRAPRKKRKSKKKSDQLARKQAHKTRSSDTFLNNRPLSLQPGRDGRYADDVDEVTSCQLASCRNAGDVSRASPGRTDRLCGSVESRVEDVSPTWP